MIDIVILVVLGLCILAGYYRGTVYSAISIGITLLSFFLSMLLIPLIAGGIRSTESVYSSLLYYFEGHEYITETSVELVHEPADSVSAEALDVIIRNADMPIPMGKAVKRNITKSVYADAGISTLGDYFNQTIVDVVLNILSLLLLFVVLRLFLGFLLRTADYGTHGFPVLKRFDAVYSCGIGFLHGVLLLYLVFLLVPIVLTVVPALEKFLDESWLGGFFYRANPLLRLIPTT